MGLGIYNIRIVSKYETKLLVRGWFFKVFAFLAIFAAIILGSIYILTQFPQPEVVNRSVIPYMFMLIMNVGQAVVSVFLASEYLKRDKQLDTSEVFYTRPLSNAEYLLGKMWATLKVFFMLDLVVALIALIMSLIKFGVDLDYLSYIWYFLLLSVPTLVFIVGLSTTLMLILNNQAITMVILLAYIGVTLFYIDNLYYYLFDYIGFNLPMLKSVVTGFSGLDRLINHRLCYLLLGIGLILTDVSLFHRLANSRYSLLPWRIAAVVFLAGGLYAGYRHIHFYKVDERFRADMVELDNRYVHTGGAVAQSCELTVTQSGDSLNVRADMTVSPREDCSQLVFTLNPGFKVNSISVPGYDMEYERQKHLIVLSFDRTLGKDQPVKLTMEYGGMADERICYLDVTDEKLIENVKVLSRLNVGKRYLFQDKEFTMLTPESYWYPRPGVAFSDQSPEWQMSYFTDFTINVTPNPGLTPISQGLCTASSDSTTYTFKPESSLPSVSLLIGDYTPKSMTVDSTLYTVWELGTWDDQFEVFDSIRDTIPFFIRDVRRYMEYQTEMAYPFKRFSIIEVPAHFTSYKRVFTSAYEQLQPEMALVHERGYDMRLFQFRNQKRNFSGGRFNRRGNNMSEKEILHNILSNALYFMWESGSFSGNSRNGQWTMTQVDNPYYYLPLFYNFRYNIYSSDWPMANRMVESMTVDGQNNGSMWMRRMNGLSEDEKALILMGKYGFDRIMSDPEWEDLADNALALKTKDFFAPISAVMGYEPMVDSIRAKTREREFDNVSFDSVLAWIQNFSGVSLEDKIEAWNGQARLACYKIGTPVITTVVTDTADIYQAEVSVENISDNPGYVNVEFVFYETENAGDEDKPKSMVISVDAGETRKIVTHWFNIPSSIRINTMLSSNLPHEVNLNNSDWSTYDGTSLTAEGVYTVRGGVDNTLPGEIIVDNEDSRLFSLSRPLRTGYLSKWIDKAKEKNNEFNYEGFSDWRTYSQWTLVTDQNLYGDYIRSAYIISPGDGNQYARWSIPVEVAGVYDVYYYATPTMYQNNNRNRRWNNNNNNWNNNNNNGRRVTNDYNFEIGQFNTSDHVSMNMWRAEEGWNLLGTFRFEADTVSVTLNNRSGIRVIVADAVRLVKRER